MTVPITGTSIPVLTDLSQHGATMPVAYTSATTGDTTSNTDGESSLADTRDPALLSYVNRLTRSALLSAEQEVFLAQRVKMGGVAGKQARAKLIEANMRLVIAVAKVYRSSGIALEDLIQEGAIGLMTATERFDWRLGYRFSTYATQWIRQAIGRAVDNKAKSIRLPAHISESLRKVERARAEYRRETGEEAGPDVVAERTGMTLRKVNMLLQTLAEPVSLDMPIGDEDSTSLGALLHDKSAPDPEEILVTAELRAEIHEILETLDEREKVIMRKRFGFDGEDTYVLQQIGDELAISRERVRQIEASALRKLRTLARQRHLRDYLHG